MPGAYALGLCTYRFLPHQKSIMLHKKNSISLRNRLRLVSNAELRKENIEKSRLEKYK